jgi:hypothetical protein
MTTWTAIRGHLHHARATHTSRRQLQRELARYTSASDLNELHAILDRYPDRDTASMRRILVGRHTL